MPDRRVGIDSDHGCTTALGEGELWREFDAARPRRFALLDMAEHGLRRVRGIHLERLPRMADFALWRASACETAFWPPGTFIHAYDVNRRAVIEGVIEADPVATFVREIMVERSTWVGKASDLLQARLYEKNAPSRTAAWPTNPRALAARLRRCQTFLRTAGIEIAFSREGRAGCLMIRMTSLTKTCAGMTASTTGNGLAA
jgi:hypothetical protein